MSGPQPADGAHPSPQQRLSELRAAVESLQAAGLDSQQQVAAARTAAADAGAQAALVAAYGRRLQRLAALLEQYNTHLHEALAALGLAEEQQDDAHTAAAQALAEGLSRLEEQLASATLDAQDAVTPEALLQLDACAEPLAPRAAAAGSAAILAHLLASVQADCQAVDGWPALAPALPADVADPAAAASPLGPAFARLHREQTHQWQAADARRQQLEALRAEVAAARAAAASANGSGSSSAPDSTQHQELAAQQAGLRAELECLERAQRAAGKAAAASSQRAAEVQAARDSVAALEAREQALDAAVRALCCADSQVMRQWRQDVWRAQEAVEMGVLAQRQPLAALGQRLAEAQRQELAAFRRAAAQQPAGSVVGGSASARSSVLAAAQLLDPLAGLKTETAAEGVMAAAAAELRELQPAAVQWAGLAEAAAGRLAALQSVAAELQGKVGALRDEGGSSALAQLREAAAAAEEGSAAVGRARQALSEWWTSPAITATPWVKREGRSAEEWLRLLGDQQRAERQRHQVLADSNRRRAPAAVS